MSESFLGERGDHPAVVMAGTGETITYRELDERSMRLAQLLHVHGLRPGDHVAVMLENHPRYFEVFWATNRSGLYLTPINWHLNADEAGYIVEDCGASVLITSAAAADVARQLEPHLSNVKLRLIMDVDVDGFTRYEDAIASQPAEPLDEQVEGSIMFYSSGTTGRPKGIERPLSGAKWGEAPVLIGALYGFNAESIYLCPAPLYHAAPLAYSMGVQRVGGTVVVMEKFDAAESLRLIERHRITHAQFVPTHFVRMLKLPEAERTAHDLSSLQVAIHAAAPCPVEVKQQMMDWWGPIIHEYYAGSDGAGATFLGPEDWLKKPGTVGRGAVPGSVHICDDEGNELPPGEPGQVWFDAKATFTYHNDPEKTAKAYNDKGWTSLGDIGYLDDEGYLFLTDRVSHMIISGGVNIYPQEVENLLTMHPAVADVAVIGVPDPDMGEQVKAVVEPADPSAAGPALEAELLAYCRAHLSAFKCPRSVDFVDELPRLESGKLLKRELRSRYWPSK